MIVRAITPAQLAALRVQRVDVARQVTEIEARTRAGIAGRPAVEQDAGAAVDINDVIEEAKARGLKFPLLIRFQDILRNRVLVRGKGSEVWGWGTAYGKTVQTSSAAPAGEVKK